MISVFSPIESPRYVLIAGPYCCHGTHQRFDPHEIPQGVVLGLLIVYRVLVTVIDADVRSGAGGDSAELLIPAVPKQPEWQEQELYQGFDHSD